jgi:hypothetical protein
MIGWARKQLEANGLQEGEPGALEHLDTDIRSPLANAYADLFIRADLAIRLLDALWVQGGLTDSGHQERTRAAHGAALGILGKPEELMRGAGTESRCNTSVVRQRR